MRMLGCIMTRRKEKVWPGSDMAKARSAAVAIAAAKKEIGIDRE